MTFGAAGSPERAATRARFDDWLVHGWTVCVFENHDLGHPSVGHRICLPYGDESEHMVIGSARPPDNASYGMGWRYVLVARCRNAEEACDVLYDGVAIHA